MTDVRFAHPGRSPTLDGFDLTLDRGEVALLAGPSGSGKSTVLRLACGSIPAVTGGRLAGRIALGGTPVMDLPTAALPAQIGYVPQDPEQAFVARTVERELESTLVNAGIPEAELAPRVEQALFAFGAGDLADRETATLSGGEAARVALAAALVAEPGLLLLDEPHAQLDQAARRELAGVLRGLAAGGTSVLLAAHEPHPFTGIVDREVPMGEPVAADPPHPLPSPRDGDPLLELEAVRHQHAPEAAPVGPIDLQLAPGEVVALTGPNGSGKTTALHAACGLIEPTEGRVRLTGEDPRALGAGERAQRVSVAFQHPAWHITQDTLREEVALTGEALDHPVDPERVLEDVGLAGLAGEHPWDLSGGERQRMAVATAVAHQPPVALLDEPTRGLDPVNRARLAGILAERTRQGKATLIASHHPWMQALAHRAIPLGVQGDQRGPEELEAELITEVVYA